MKQLRRLGPKQDAAVRHRPRNLPVILVQHFQGICNRHDRHDGGIIPGCIKKIPYETTDRKGNKVTKYRKYTKDEIDQKVKRVLKIVDLEGFEKRYISTLSGGQQQRIAIARAIVNEPEILLLDEPLGALDLKMRKEMQLELKEMHKKLGITFIYVTHDQEEALTMSDTIVVMKSGEIQQVGTPTDVYNEPVNSYVANFIGESNIYNATMVGKKKVKFLNHVFSCVDNFPENEKVDVVIRPEDVELAKVKADYSGEKLNGIVAQKIFKGVYYQYVIEIGRWEVVAQDTKNREVGDRVTIDIDAMNIQVMKKFLVSNSYPDAWINNKNQVMISETPFDCDITKLLSGSKIDDDGYLVSKDGKKYDLKDADVIAEVAFADVQIFDGFDNGDVNAIVASVLYKGDHYAIICRTENDEDFLLDSEYAYNEGDQVSIKIDPSKINLTLKGDISKYEKE